MRYFARKRIDNKISVLIKIHLAFDNIIWFVHNICIVLF